MKTPMLLILSLPCLVANAQSYRCPADFEGAHLSNAKIQIGVRQTAHALHGDVEQRQDGTNIDYTLPDDVPRWLVCQYGGRRIGGTAISGPDVIGGREAWIQLNPLIHTCKLAIRASEKLVSGASNWTAEASCKRNEPPPPDMV
jgi:hypothetical protein